MHIFIRLYGYILCGYKRINAYVYKDIKVYLYVNTRMCLCVNMRHINTHIRERTNTYMCICALCIYDVTHFLRVQRMKASEFGRPCLTNAHLAFGA